MVSDITFSDEGSAYNTGTANVTSIEATVSLNLRTSLTSYQVDPTFVRAQFEEHCSIWRDETKHISSPPDKLLHSSYARIIGLGPAAVPLILQSLTTAPGDWFYALRAITGENPVAPEMAGRYPEMASAWILWGQRKGLI